MPNIALTVNGRRWSGEIRAGESLLDVLRDRLHLTGAKLGCGEGQCGSCTVLVNRRAVTACTTAAESVSGTTIISVEGLAQGGNLHPVQQAFIDAQAFQCGFCTPGMITAAVALIEQTPAPRDEEITRALNGHLCRCGTYPRIVEAVRAAAASMQKGRRRG
jgi:nicotinate dehydrogenase subunit A